MPPPATAVTVFVAARGPFSTLTDSDVNSRWVAGVRRPTEGIGPSPAAGTTSSSALLLHGPRDGLGAGALPRTADRGEAVLFELVDVFVAAAEQILGLIGGFRWATGLNAHDAVRDDRAAIEPCALEAARAQTGRRHRGPAASRSVRQEAQDRANTPKGATHDVTSTVPHPKPGTGRIRPLFQRGRTRT